jgi:hypothetical protein
MSIELLIIHSNKKENISFVSTYHPHSGYPEGDIIHFYENYDAFLSNIWNKNKFVIGCDANTPLGIVSSTSDKCILGKFGDPYRRNNTSEFELKNIMLSLNLRSSTSDFKNKRYDTFVGNGISEGKHQIDFISISNDLRKNVMNAKRTQNGVDSDHAAIILLTRFVLNKSKRKFAKKKEKNDVRLDWKRLKCPIIANQFSNKVEQIILNNNSIISPSSSAELLEISLIDYVV